MYVISKQFISTISLFHIVYNRFKTLNFNFISVKHNLQLQLSLSLSLSLSFSSSQNMSSPVAQLTKGNSKVWVSERFPLCLAIRYTLTQLACSMEASTALQRNKKAHNHTATLLTHKEKMSASINTKKVPLTYVASGLKATQVAWSKSMPTLAYLHAPPQTHT